MIAKYKVVDMTNVDMFQEHLRKILDYHKKENNLNYAEVLGVLEIIKHELLFEFDKES